MLGVATQGKCNMLSFEVMWLPHVRILRAIRRNRECVCHNKMGMENVPNHIVEDISVMLSDVDLGSLSRTSHVYRNMTKHKVEDRKLSHDRALLEELLLLGGHYHHGELSFRRPLSPDKKRAMVRRGIVDEDLEPNYSVLRGILGERFVHFSAIVVESTGGQIVVYGATIEDVFAAIEDEALGRHSRIRRLYDPVEEGRTLRLRMSKYIDL